MYDDSYRYSKGTSMRVTKKEVIKKINANLIHHLEFLETHEIEVIENEKLLDHCRFDVMAKYIYAKHYRNRYDLEWAKEVYREHLRVWGDFVEVDLSGKDNFGKYIESFNKLLDSFDKNGFDENISLLPVGDNGIIIDGSHRVAACLAYNENPKTVIFKHKEACYKSQFFHSRGLSEIYLDSMATEYAKLSKACYIVCLFPIGISKKRVVDQILSSYGSIVYEKQVHFFNYGPVNIIAQLYTGEHWVGRREDGWPGALTHAKNKFIDNQPVTFYLFECHDLLLVKEVKAKIRNLFDYANHSAHINDTQEETVRISEQIFNENSIHLLNYGDLSRQNKVHILHKRFKEDIKKNNYNKETLCVDSSSIIALYGLRDSNDLDYLSYCDKEESFSNSLINNHNDELKHYNHSLDELVFNPKYFLYYDGIKYSSLRTVMEMKMNRSEIKDLQDVNLIKTVANGESPEELKPLSGLRKKKKNIKITKEIIQRYIPIFMMPIAKKLYMSLRSIKASLYKFPDYLHFGNVRMKYLGFDLLYSPGTSLIDRIRFGQIYEPNVTTAIIRELQKIDNPVIIDIGSNIGLISLNILKFYPNTKIYAFEPGPHQHKLFSKTIEINNLNESVQLYDIALSNNNGEAVFNIHQAKHASGDGFKNTERAGKTKKIKVQVRKLDNWWEEANKPKINIIKIDTEGAELLVLKGAINLLNEIRPIILMEISALNLKVYEYNEKDVLIFLKSHGYILKTIAGTIITLKNIDYYMSMFNEFLAIPCIEK